MKLNIVLRINNNPQKLSYNILEKEINNKVNKIINSILFDSYKKTYLESPHNYTNMIKNRQIKNGTYNKTNNDINLKLNKNILSYNLKEKTNTVYKEEHKKNNEQLSNIYDYYIDGDIIHLNTIKYIWLKQVLIIFKLLIK
ncbi:hypothetical protein HEP_00497300, partial [Hepatocystis sp. ex Piliocolobus tephrosceles]